MTRHIITLLTRLPIYAAITAAGLLVIALAQPQPARATTAATHNARGQ